MDRAQVQASRFLSLVLRHKPDAAGVSLDNEGWCEVKALLKGCALHGHTISSEELDVIVAENDKKRFEFSDDRKRIRARHGHSIEVDLKYEPQTPPKVLYHGTATRFLDSIRKVGLIKGSRQHVHLSGISGTAFKVGQRHGRPVVIPIKAGEMHRSGIRFYLTANEVWLVEAVPPHYRASKGCCIPSNKIDAVVIQKHDLDHSTVADFYMSRSLPLRAAEVTQSHTGAEWRKERALPVTIPTYREKSGTIQELAK